MKFFLFFFVILLQNSSNGQFSFTLTGNVPSSMNRKYIILRIKDNYSKDKYEWTDTAIIKGNKFFFTGKIIKPTENAELSLIEKGQFFYFALDSGQLQMEIKPLPSGWLTYKNKLSNIEIKNSVSNLINDSLRILINQYYNQYGKPASNENRIIQLDSIRNRELWFKQLEIIERHADHYYSLICLFKLLSLRQREAVYVEKVFKLLPEYIKNTKLGEDLSSKLNAILSTQIGRTIFEFSANTSSGTLFSNTSLKDKTYLIVFGATWCQPCKENFPILKNLYKKYKDKGFEIVSINLDEKKEIWIKQIKSFDLNWINISELKKWKESNLVQKFGINYIPFEILIGKDGTIIYNSSQLKDSELKMLDKLIFKNID